MVHLKVIQKITPIDVSVSETIDQKPHLKNLGGGFSPGAQPGRGIWGICHPRSFQNIA